MHPFPELRPRVASRFYLAHGLGNDYLVMREGEEWLAGPEAVELLCDRWRGAGSDGLVVVGPSREPNVFDLRMFNPDGSEFERSGNGLRIAASFLLHEGSVTLGTPFRVRVGGDSVLMTVHGSLPTGEHDVSVEMGAASTGPDAVGLDREALDPEVTRGSHGWLATGNNGPLPVHLVSVGNPHCVVFVDALDPEGDGCFTDAALRSVGPGLTGHPAFAAGTNVQLAEVRGRSWVAAKIWERGVGPTSASGTSACAVAVAAVESGRCDAGQIRIEMEGGDLTVAVTSELSVVLRGPVREVCVGELTAGFVRALISIESAGEHAH